MPDGIGADAAFWVERRAALEGALVRYLGSHDGAAELEGFSALAQELVSEAERRGPAVVLDLSRLLHRAAQALRRHLPGEVPFAHRAAALAEGVALFSEAVGALMAGQTPALAGTLGAQRLNELLGALEGKDGQLARRGEIALVDDNAMSQRVIGAILSTAGFAVRTYTTAAAALGGILSDPPDLVLLDIVLGDEDGRDLFKELRREPALDLIPILFLTAYAEPQDVVLGFSIGADDYIPKLVRPEELIARVSARLERARAAARVALLDPLTGVGNRRYLESCLIAEAARSQRESSRFSVVLIDLDRFKDVNDRFGHAAGDEVLISCAQTLRAGLRPYDVVARYGGEEFALILPGADAHLAGQVVERLRQALLARAMPGVGGLAISFSAGVAGAPGDAQKPDEMLKVADRRLYAAKALGRGRVICEES
jgi:diguanylate cyclase (GGDEF)-like protein